MRAREGLEWLVVINSFPCTTPCRSEAFFPFFFTESEEESETVPKYPTYEDCNSILREIKREKVPLQCGCSYAPVE